MRHVCVCVWVCVRACVCVHEAGDGDSNTRRKCVFSDLFKLDFKKQQPQCIGKVYGNSTNTEVTEIDSSGALQNTNGTSPLSGLMFPGWNLAGAG